ncbi:hypothetical protein P8605_35800, partial [Streptomyces sp. T-3]|nr:hypothetical protein [Streptomyces sp. T-3]
MAYSFVTMVRMVAGLPGTRVRPGHVDAGRAVRGGAHRCLSGVHRANRFGMTNDNSNEDSKQTRTGRATRKVEAAAAKAEENAHTKAGAAAGKAEAAGRAT